MQEAQKYQWMGGTQRAMTFPLHTSAYVFRPSGLEHMGELTPTHPLIKLRSWKYALLATPARKIRDT